MLKRKSFFVAFLITIAAGCFAQSNSPYSRYGFGDVMPNTNVVNRAMGGVAIADTDFVHINFNNPASFSNFLVGKDPKSKKINFGRVILDAGINLENRTIREPNRADKFTSSDLFFSYLHVGVPLRKNWGLAFGLRPLTRISYLMNSVSYIPSGDSILSENAGNGGVYLPTIGTGFAIKNLSLGVNLGYIFGRMESSVSKGVLNDTSFFYDALYKTETSFGKIYVDAGLQYKIPMKGDRYLTLGAAGNLKKTMKANREVTNGTFINDPNGPLVDTLYKVSETGEVIYPANYTFGFMTGRSGKDGLAARWQAGMDVVMTGWDEFRNFGRQDQVQSTTQIRIGGSFKPKTSRSYGSLITYRAGFHTGEDYVTAGGNLKAWGGSLGLGLPLINRNRLAQGQATTVNVALEYNQRGNNSNILKENIFRLSVGLNFSDIWFSKRKYD